MRALELLAPARNLEIGIAAIDCGADAVYLAGPSFGARQAAGNSLEDVKALCDYAHRFGARVYVTVNTIIYDEELEEAFALAQSLQEAGADALIVQDFALVRLKQLHPDRLSIPLHASTQCSIRTPQTAQRLRALGFSRLVLERELGMEEVSHISSSVDAEIEAFVHGALCVCFSGQCYLSVHLNGRSANRGECIQACRSRYDLVDRDGKPLKDGGRALAMDKTLLSLKDLNMMEHLGALAEAGVVSFKIEGRLKGISYVRNVVGAYSGALDALVESSGGRYCRASFGRSRLGFTPDVNKSFNRGFTDLGHSGQWACLDAGKAMGEYLGRVAGLRCPVGAGHDVKGAGHDVRGEARHTRPDRVSDPLGCPVGAGHDVRGAGNDVEIILADCRAAIHNGDGLSFIGPDGRESGFKADIAEGNRIICKKVPGLRSGTVLWRNYDSAFEKEVSKPSSRLITTSISFKSEALSGTVFKLEISAVTEDGRTACLVREENSELARDRQRMKEILSAQLSKTTGIFAFGVARIEGDLPLLKAAAINALRREIAEQLQSTECHFRPILNVRAEVQAACPDVADYRNDVANELAAEVYRRGGSRFVYPAYELSVKGIHPKWGDRETSRSRTELMRSRYCLLRELGYCKKTPEYRRLAAQNRLGEGIFIRNNSRMLMLDFDCSRCEMTVCPPC